MKFEQRLEPLNRNNPQFEYSTAIQISQKPKPTAQSKKVNLPIVQKNQTKQKRQNRKS